MIIFGFEMPPGSTRGPVVIVVVIERENIDRMQQADPFDVQFRMFPEGHGIALSGRVRDIDLIIAYEEDIGKLVEFREKKDLAGLLDWLERGRKIKADDLRPITKLRRT